MALRVGLNLLHLVPGETGGSEVYARRLAEALAARRDVELVAFVPREAAGLGEGIELVVTRVPGRSRAVRVAAEQTLLPALARRRRLDVLHNVFSTAPAVAAAPQVTTIHDLIYLRFPETHAGLRAYGMRLLVPLAARRSRRLIAVSEATKRDLVQLLGVDADRVDVTYEGPGMASDGRVSEDEVRRRFGLGDAPLVLTVSSKRPHKNVARLIDAVGRLDEPAVLLVPGYETPFEDELRRRAAATDRVRFAGWLDDATLDGLYRAATCFVFPSLAEGFGLPVLEAMVRGTPVACSDATSLPEVAGEAALYFDPMNTEAITDALRQLLRDPDLRERLRRAGYEQARRFSWEQTAARTVESYRRALSSRS